MSDDKQKDQQYFNYYGQLIHQQNMLSDLVRTALYKSVCERFSNADFRDKLVMDVGAGSGVLSMFAVQAGARHVYAVEASSMALTLNEFLDRSSQQSYFRDRITVLHDTVESFNDLDHLKVDTIISEPIGVLLVHERMLESFLLARDRFLKPGGSIFPSSGTIHLSPFMDDQLWSETKQKADWWLNQTNFYGIDFSSMRAKASDEVFSMSIVGCFNSQILISHLPSSHQIDFTKIKLEQLHNINIELDWLAEKTALIHGLAGWFDCGFSSSRQSAPVGLRLDTHPESAPTHWQQIRFLLKEPLAVNTHTRIRGDFMMTVNESRSYDIESCLWAVNNDGSVQDNSRRQASWKLQEQTFNYSPVAVNPQYPQYPSLATDQANSYGVGELLAEP